MIPSKLHELTFYVSDAQVKNDDYLYLIFRESNLKIVIVSNAHVSTGHKSTLYLGNQIRSLSGDLHPDPNLYA